MLLFWSFQKAGRKGGRKEGKEKKNDKKMKGKTGRGMEEKRKKIKKKK